MLRLFSSLMLVLGLGILFQPNAVFAQKNPAQEQKDDQKIRDAENALKTAKSKLDDAQKDLKTAGDKANKADREHDAALAVVKKARLAAQEKQDEAPAIRDALAAQERAKAAYDKLVEPLLEKLHAAAEYRTVATAAETARNRLRTIRSEGLPPAQMEAEVTVLNRTITEPSKLDQATIEKDSAAAAAREKLLAAQNKVGELRKDARELVEKDPQLRKAVAEVEKAEKEHKQALAHLADKRRDVANHQRDVQAKQQGVENAKQADRKNDNPPKKKK